jgi:mono/diheme cytochrome c family protein
MSDAKTPKTLFLLLILALAGAVLVAGCGGGGSSSSTTTGGEEMSEKEARSGEGSLAAEGKEVFTSNCGSCHTLSAAGTSGEVGPDLDELEPDLATVEHQVVNGGGGMPAFGETLNAKELKAVATYVSSVAGQG